jgi:tRNA modification GTPase
LHAESNETIAAIATPVGNGGVGVIRVSGPQAKNIGVAISGKTLSPRTAIFTAFLDENRKAIDLGILLYFPSPKSYTGEDVLELQAHGGSVVLNMLLKRLLALGARPARPGEFTERAFLNNKLDLTQAEAVADLIESNTEQAVRSAQRSLQGFFSEQIQELMTELTELRVYIEAAIDFVEEEIDFLGDGVIENRLLQLIVRIEQIQRSARQGRLLREGMTVVLAGKPNAGKSSLLNALVGHDAAIVTEIAGTTRDVLRECIQIDGMPLHIIDTAGLRESTNAVEREGIRRARQEIGKADKIFLLIDIEDADVESIATGLPANADITRIYNKIDRIEAKPRMTESADGTEIYLSIKTGAGMDLLKEYLKRSAGYIDQAETIFAARARHLDALERGLKHVQNALDRLRIEKAGELVAEELRIAQHALGEITGEVSSDDLLGKIFSSFCIGK